MFRPSMIRFVVVVVLLGALAVACTSPAVTGMKVHMQNGEYEDVIHLADSIIASGDSLNADIWFWRGKAYTELNKWREAADSFWRVHELGDTESKALNEYWFVFFNSAAGLINDGDVNGGIGLLEQGMEIAPERPDFQLMLGDVALNVNDELKDALEYFRKAADKAGALADELRKKIDRAGNEFDREYYSNSLERMEGTQIQALYNTGSVCTMLALEARSDAERETYIEQAKENYEKALEIDPSNIDVLDALAGIYLLEEKYDEALDIYDKTLANIDTGVSEGWLDKEEADALKADVLVSKGYALIEMEDYDQAAMVLNQARAIKGNDYIVLTSLAHVNFVRGDYQAALDNLEEVFRIRGLSNEELAKAYYMKYACYNRLEQDADAAEAMETALEYQPDNADYWRYLASTYSRLGRRNDAIAAMEKAGEIDR